MHLEKALSRFCQMDGICRKQHCAERVPGRNDLAKSHYCLVPFDELSEADKKIDEG